MSETQTIDTDELRQLCEAAPEYGSGLIYCGGPCWYEGREFYIAACDALYPLLDELDRLRAAEAAGKARVETVEKLFNECAEARDGAGWLGHPADAIRGMDAELGAARAEIARLSEAGAGQDWASGIAAAVAVVNELWAEAEIAAGQADNAQDKALNEERLRYGDEILVALSNLVANAPPPPVDTASGVPGQRVNIAKLIYERLQDAELLHPNLFDWAATTEDAPFYALADEIAKITALAASPKPEDVRREASSYQQRVDDWLLACFGETIARDREERNHRFIEEALELVQANGCTASEAHQLVDYVYGRPVGELDQEVGGVMNTLAALCLASGVDLDAAAEKELARVWTKVEKIRAKQAAKPKHSPLPEAAR